MTIAVLFTLFTLPHASLGNYLLILIGVAIGGIGVVIAQRIPMTAMPQLVAGFQPGRHGCRVRRRGSAVQPGGVPHHHAHEGDQRPQPLEMGLGAIIGAITFSGSVIAFAKLQALMRSAPILLPQGA